MISCVYNLWPNDYYPFLDIFLIHSYNIALPIVHWTRASGLQGWIVQLRQITHLSGCSFIMSEKVAKFWPTLLCKLDLVCLQSVQIILPKSFWKSFRKSVWKIIRKYISKSVWNYVRKLVEKSVMKSINNSVPKFIPNSCMPWPRTGQGLVIRKNP